MTGVSPARLNLQGPARHLLHRTLILAVLLAAEWLPISALVSTGRGGQSFARALAAFAFFFLAFGYYKATGILTRISLELEAAPVGWRFLAGHVCCMAIFLVLSVAPNLLRLPPAVSWPIWLGAGLLGIVLAAFAFVPPHLWFEWTRATGSIWIFALLAAAAAWRMVVPSWSIWGGQGWQPLTDSTFALAKFLLGLFVSDPMADRSTMVLGTSRFAVRVAAACSGLEGGALILVFTVGWLWFFRRECRFPQALTLIPMGLAAMWFLNGVRITALILIGTAGAPAIAMGGFHSQAGWISFNLVSLGVVIAAGRVPWWTRATREQSIGKAVDNPSAAYLAPILLILASAMLGRAVSSGFEWLYPLRFAAAAAALWHFRPKYQRLGWRFDGWAVAAGTLVFLLWIALDLLTGAHHGDSMPAALASSSAIARIGWLTFRTLAAVVTVPIAEELAFRGFLIRRLMSADFESLNLQSYTWPAVLISSLIFGLLHGDRWIAGTLAGLIYVVMLLRRGRIGDAIVAHATTNALIAIMVLSRGRWDLW